jgi:mono/diheme cytochrome c family protein
MKASLTALGISALFLCSSLALAQHENASPYKRQNDPTLYDELAKAPEKARAKPNPLEKDPDAVAAGQLLFEQHCSECHGDTAQGARKGPSLLVDQVQNAQPGALFWLLTNGVVRRGMPVWSKLPEPQRWQLVSYIKSLGVALRKAENQPPAKPQQ